MVSLLRRACGRASWVLKDDVFTGVVKEWKNIFLDTPM
jgi:hypothetical protein